MRKEGLEIPTAGVDYRALPKEQWSVSQRIRDAKRQEFEKSSTEGGYRVCFDMAFDDLMLEKAQASLVQQVCESAVVFMQSVALTGEMGQLRHCRLPTTRSWGCQHQSEGFCPFTPRVLYWVPNVTASPALDMYDVSRLLIGYTFGGLLFLSKRSGVWSTLVASVACLCHSVISLPFSCIEDSHGRLYYSKGHTQVESA